MTGYTSVESDIDVIILKKSGAADNQNNQTITCGDQIATIFKPASWYLLHHHDSFQWGSSEV